MAPPVNKTKYTSIFFRENLQKVTVPVELAVLAANPPTPILLSDSSTEHKFEFVLLNRPILTFHDIAKLLTLHSFVK